MRKFWTILAPLVLLSGMAEAQDFPTRTVRIVAPFAAGGPTDLATRALADGLSKMWGQPVAVENKPGGGTIIGIMAVKTAPPDGYTLGSFSPSYVINPGVRSGMPYDTLKDLVGVSMLVESPSAIVAHPSFPANTLPELIEAAKKSAKPYAYATSGLGSFGHMSGELLQRQAGIKLEHVPYGGGSQAVIDVIAGRVPLLLANWSDERAYVESKQLKLIAAYSEKPLPGAPKVDTIGKVLPEFTAVAFNGIIAPAGIDKALLNKISKDIQTVIRSEEFTKRARGFAATPYPTSPEETDAFIRREVNRWIEIGKAANIKLQ